ncbi:MAG: methionine ABC transporter substrate-binding protein, partial [Oscillospiraceae bacterium]|nr:methionine ABC transporter substrate-binding protein [Oscillospiraceae bacterium]
LENFCENNNMDLVSAVTVHFVPLGLYKGTGDTLENIAEGATIAVPNDPTNEARALQLLAAQGLISLKEGVGLAATKNDIVDNPKNIEILEIEAAQLPRTLPDVAFAVINGNYALEADVIDSLVLTEDPQSDAAQEFANILAVRAGDENSEITKALVEVLTSAETKAFIEKTYGATVIAVF